MQGAYDTSVARVLRSSSRIHTAHGTRHTCRLFFWDVSIRNSLRSNNIQESDVCPKLPPCQNLGATFLVANNSTKPRRDLNLVRADFHRVWWNSCERAGRTRLRGTVEESMYGENPPGQTHSFVMGEGVRSHDSASRLQKSQYRAM